MVLTLSSATLRQRGLAQFMTFHTWYFVLVYDAMQLSRILILVKVTAHSITQTLVVGLCYDGEKMEDNARVPLDVVYCAHLQVGSKKVEAAVKYILPWTSRQA